MKSLAVSSLLVAAVFSATLAGGRLAAGQPPRPLPDFATRPVVVDRKVDGKTAREWKATATRLGAKVRGRGTAIVKLKRSLRAQLQLGSHGIERAFLCIHSHEGTWDDDDAPYWGGVQMDLDFMRTYGPEFFKAWGTADNWPRSVQLAVAMRAYLAGRGFHPWPNTARRCGLL